MLRRKLKIILDFLMTVLLPLLMAYQLIGEVAHEWLGMAMFVLFICHHLLNRHWTYNLLKGKYTIVRIWQTVLVTLVFFSMIGSMLSSIILSYYVFPFVSIQGWHTYARSLHMLSAYWGFIFMALHLGFHWNMMIAGVRKFIEKKPTVYVWVLRILALFIAGYGVYAFIERNIGRYMLMLEHYVFFDFSKPIIFFVLDYIAVIGLFVFVGHYVTNALRKIGQNKTLRKKVSPANTD